MKEPKWLKEPTTRKRSDKQEKRIANMSMGRVAINSGATLGQNDVIADNEEFECKTTHSKSFVLKLSDWEKLVDKIDPSKSPVMVITFEREDLDLAVIRLEDLKALLGWT